MWEGRCDDSTCPRWRPQGRLGCCVDPGPNVGGGLPPMAALGPTRILCRSRPKCGRGLAPDGGLRADQDVGSDRVHIRFCGNGCLGFRPYGGSLLKSAKVSKTLLPHHSAPRLGSVCPNAGLNPWAAAMGHPWPSAANPASCRVAHGFKPAFGQRGLTGRLGSKADQDQDQERLASHRGYRLQRCVAYAPMRRVSKCISD
ncbi:Threonine synthase [Pseudomonas orientalis]|nr:Threonine synthase [Pseudomonas orientalis]